MRTARIIHVVSCHAEGEVGDVIVGGVPPPPGATLWDWFTGTHQLMLDPDDPWPESYRIADTWPSLGKIS